MTFVWFSAANPQNYSHIQSRSDHTRIKIVCIHTIGTTTYCKKSIFFSSTNEFVFYAAILLHYMTCHIIFRRNFTWNWIPERGSSNFRQIEHGLILIHATRRPNAIIIHHTNILRYRKINSLKIWKKFISLEWTHFHIEGI